MPYRRGRKSAAQTPAPRSERIKGSKNNPKGTAASQSSAAKIVLSDKTIKALSEKAREYNKNHKSSVSLNTLKAVFRRGAGAYSSSHRPTITGGVPNSRNAWAMARVNKFLMKKAGKKVKAAYVQDDDLLAKGGNVFDDKQLLKRYKQGKSIGFSAEAHLKAKGLLPRADGTTRKSEKYKKTYAKRIAKTYSKGQIIDEKKQNMKGFDDEVIICSNCLWSWKASESTPEEKYICHKCGHDNTPTMDKITMDVPLFIRLFEFAREDAKDDMELHTLTENALKLGDKTLTMEDYKQIIFSNTTSPKITKSTNSVVEFPTIEEEFADGGVVVGKRHSESDENGTGEKFLVKSTGQIVELEGGEGVLCKESMQSKKIYKFEGKEMNGRQIASFLNHKYGGVEFAKGGQVDEKSVCGCRSMYYHGGELPSATLDSLQGGEAVVTVKTMESKDKFSFQGRQMTPRKILSHINQESGGKKFEDGGIIDLTEHHLKNATNMVKMINFTEKIFYF